MNIADYAPPRKYLASERAVETAASLVMAGIRDGQSVGFRTNAGEKSEKRDGGSPEGEGIPPGLHWSTERSFWNPWPAFGLL